VTATVHSSNGQ
jgi:hypothetical protein